MTGTTDFSEVVLEVSDFVALVNQTFEYAYPSVTIRGELANFKVSKNKWVYFDLKDETATVRFFGTVYQLIGPLEDGMLLKVHGAPRLHPQYGFSVTVLSLQPEGEGTIRRAAALLEAKLQAEGLFDPSRKRPLPYPPARIGLITSTESAAYADFIKVLAARWRGVTIECVDVQVQGEAALEQIVAAITYFNQQSTPPGVLVMTRGGGSAEDLYAFSTEQVVRAVAASRVPTLVAIGHEVDVSLAELAADQRASTPSNAAELLVPDRKEVLSWLQGTASRLQDSVLTNIRANRQMLASYDNALQQALATMLSRLRAQLLAYHQLLQALNPRAILRRGYAIVRHARGGVRSEVVRSRADLHSGDIVDIEWQDGDARATIR
jgi:exodeoxyribonuclease VII large subunit